MHVPIQEHASGLVSICAAVHAKPTGRKCTHIRACALTQTNTHTYHAYMLFKKCMKNTFALTIVYAIYQTKISARQGYSLALEVVFYLPGKDICLRQRSNIINKCHLVLSMSF